jgi:signal transduction histidine kinase
MHRTPLYLEDLLHDTVRAVRQIADRRRVTVELQEVAEAPFDGDADLLGRVVLNVLDNAIRHSPEGGTVGVRLTEGATAYHISVVDGGSGIPAEATERVFDRFFRVDSARSQTENTVTSGAGLGLAIGRRIAELHGGGLELVSSAPGRTEFRLTLPRVRSSVGLAAVSA